MNTPSQVTIVSHTHWDRAWYVPYQEFRVRLVRLVDRLLKLMQTNPDYRLFTLDGQMAVLEDYLEVRPGRQAELQALCRHGRIIIGPWYVLADEFLVSPEALIRNMQLGHRMGESFGGVSKIGYVPDGFGHIAQLPQILQGFGIDNAFFWRGLGQEGDRLGTEFTWKAPDGSAVTAIWMPWGYHNISNLGYPIHWGDTSQMEFDYELALKQIRLAIDQLKPMGHTPAILLMNGIDHEEAESRLPEIVSRASQRFTDCQFTHGTLLDHLKRVRATEPELPAFTGEFRWGKYSEILQGVYASRIHLKQINQRVENLLEHYAEPLATIAWAFAPQGIPEGTQDLLRTAWHWLLQNHPHDDIYGAGIDPIHEEMLYRFSQAQQIGDIIVRDSLRQINREVDFCAQPGLPILVYNPLGWERGEMAVGDVDFDFDDSLAADFQLVNGEGQVIPCQVLSDQPAFWMETLKANRKRRVRVVFPANIPACGYASYYIQPSPSQAKKDPPPDGWHIYANSVENIYCSFEIEEDGGITITDRASGVTYAGLGHFEDVEDAGDEYSSCPCPDTRLISSQGVPASTHPIIQGPNQVTYEIRRTLDIPAGLTEDRQRRSEHTIPMVITSRVTLYRNQPGLYIETELDNQGQDHKLRVVFPTGLNPSQVDVDASFAVLKRAIDLPNSTGWVEDPTPMMHQRAFSDLSQDGHGLAILNRGLPAVEVTRQAGGAHISLVLLRCTGWLSRDDLTTRRVAAGPLAPTPGGQCPGKHRFEYAILPHSGDWRSVYQRAYAYNSSLLVGRADTHEGLDLHEMNITNDDPAQVKPIPWPRAGKLPGQLSFISTEASGLVLSALYRTYDQRGVVVRYYNIWPEPLEARIHSFRAIKNVWLANLNEEKQAELPLLDQHTFMAKARGHQIITFILYI